MIRLLECNPLAAIVILPQFPRVSSTMTPSASNALMICIVHSLQYVDSLPHLQLSDPDRSWPDKHYISDRNPSQSSRVPPRQHSCH